MRRDFILPEIDSDYLNLLGLPWETLNEGNHKWLIIHDFVVPNGYNVKNVSVALLIDPGYPIAQIDMAYFYPHLIRNDGKNIGALANQPIDGKQWQRWSRHRTGENPWRAGIDDISTHLLLINNWMEREFNK